MAVLGLTSAWVVGAGGGAGVEQLGALVHALLADPCAPGHAAILGTVLWTGVGTTAGCTLVESAALGELSSADATVVFATEPLWGAGFAFLLLGETMGPQCQLGGMLMVLACVVSSTGGEMAPGEMAPPSPAELALSARARLQAAQGTAAAALAWAVETMGLAMGCSMGRGRSANPKRSRALARANMRMLGGARRKR